MRKKVFYIFLVSIFFIFSSSFQTTKPVNASTQKVTINVDILNIREGPGLSYPVTARSVKGNEYELLQKKGDWYKIQLPSGKTGWVASWHVTVNSVSKKISKTGKVTVDHLNLRTSPNLSSSIITKLNSGDQVEILQVTSGWFQVSKGSQKGWVSSQYVSNSETNNGNRNNGTTQNKQLFGIVTVSQLNVRDTASLNGKVIDSVSKGESYQIIEEANNWVKIKLKSNQFGWIAGWFLEKTEQNTNQIVANKNNNSVTLVNDGTNLRSEPNTDSTILARGNSGESFQVIGKKNDWYEIQLSNGRNAYVAAWLVISASNNNQNTNNSNPKGLKGKTIVIDPGHGGRDSGTIGFIGTLEKNITIRTAQQLSTKLKNAGANVIMTRKDDRYVALPSRVSISQYNDADAYISIHYDSITDQSVTGHTSYYYHSYQKLLAEDVHKGISSEVNIKDRGVRFGDFHVIRENRQPAVLVELGYLSNPNQEATINTSQYQDTVTTGIYEGLQQYFK